MEWRKYFIDDILRNVLYITFLDENILHPAVFGIKTDAFPFLTPVKAFERRFIVHQRNNDPPSSAVFCFLNTTYRNACNVTMGIKKSWQFFCQLAEFFSAVYGSLLLVIIQRREKNFPIFCDKGIRMCHAVYPEFGDRVMLFRIAEGIVTVIFPKQSVEGKLIGISVMLICFLLSCCVLHIPKLNALAGLDRSVQQINGIVQRFIIALDSAAYVEVAVKLCGLMDTCQVIQLCDQPLSFLFGDEPGGFHSIYQQL